MGESWGKIADHGVELCGECHEEVLGEPIYLPVTHALLAHLFRKRSRVEKVVILAIAIALGTKQLAEWSKENADVAALVGRFAQ